MTALVTGAGQRLGRELALHLARRGHDVAIHYNRSVEGAEATAAEARAFGVRAQTFQADLTGESETQRLFPAVLAAMGKLDLLINSAAVLAPDDIRSATRESWDRHMAINLRAPFVLMQEFARQAPPAAEVDGQLQAGALIVNLVDHRVEHPSPDRLSYALSKSGLWSLTCLAAQSLGPDIRVNAIGPGSVLKGAHQSTEDFIHNRARTPLQRGSDISDIARALDYLMSSPAVTGQLLFLDGGSHLFV